MPLDLRMQKKLDGYCWAVFRGKHRLATSGRFYSTYRDMRLSLIGFLKSVQADNFIVYDDTEEAPSPAARKRKSKGVQAGSNQASRSPTNRRATVPVQPHS